MAEFSPAIKIVLKHEGGYVNNPNDPGGETKYGISKASYPHLNIKNLTENEAKGIYYQDYWLKNGLNGIVNQNTANFALDTLVHHGQGAKILQQAVADTGGYTAPDNAMGPKTIAAINSLPQSAYLTNAIKRRIKYMEDLVRRNPALAEFLTGWKIRAGFFLVKPYIIPALSLLTLGALYFYLRQK